MTKIKHMLIAACALVAFNACADTPPGPAHAMGVNAGATAQLDAVIAGDWRSEKNRARDQYRHPKQTLAFFGVKPTDTLIEIYPSGGWYTEILAPLLRDKGRYIGAIVKPDSAEGEEASNKKGIRAKLAADPAHYDKATIIEFTPKTASLGAPNSVDAVLTFRNVHNMTDEGSAQSVFKAMYDVLKPGGTLGVEDHRAKAGTTLEQNKEKGYLPEDAVIKLATDAGFKLVGKSEINANPKDTKDYAKGVWTLPPTLALKDQDRAKYLAIGESDRMTLKFVKPAK